MSNTIHKLRRRITQIVHTEQGASMVEYALLVVLIAIIAFVAVQIAGNEVSAVFDEVAQSLVNAG